MDNNPERRASESSEDEELYVLAPETYNDDSDDDVRRWYDAFEEVQNDSEEQRQIDERDRLHHDQKHDKSLKRSFSPENQANLGSSEENLKHDSEQSSKRNVLETNVDSGEQRYITQMEPLRDESTQVSSDEACITFHALVSSDIDFQAETDHVILVMWDGVYSTNQVLAKEMKFVCYQHEVKSAAEITCSVTLKKSILQHASYRYFIKKEDSFWEKIYTYSHFERRVLYFPFQKNLEGLQKQFHQYDGYIYQTVQSGVWKTIKGVFSQNENEDAGLVTRVFAQDIAKTLLRNVPNYEDIQRATTMSVCLKQGIERIYQIHSSMVKKALWGVYSNMLQGLVNIEDDLTVKRKMAMCILMLELQQLIDVNVNDPSIELICRSFRLKVDRKSETVVEWIYVTKYLNNRNRQMLKERLILLASDIASASSYGKNPSWFYFLPMIHFLDGTCLPFQEVTLEINHRDAQPKWWGISYELENVIKKFKRINGTWKISLRQVCDSLQDMFETDFYLPRTMLASLSIQEFKDALDTRVFPPDICCACICYFIYSRKHINQIQKCMDSLLLHASNTGLHGIDQRRAWLGINLSIDLLYAAIDQNRERLVLSSLYTFLWFLASFDPIDAETSNVQMPFSLETVKTVVVYWLQDYETQNRPKMTDLLQLWDKILSPKDIPNTRGMKKWTAMIKLALEEKIKHDLQKHYEGQYERCLVEAYCSHVETYSPVLQELLSSYILLRDCLRMLNLNLRCTLQLLSYGELQPFIVVEDIISFCQTPSAHPTKDTNIYKKLRKTMSKKFVEKCEELAKASNGLDLETILSWRALPKFMEVLYQNCNTDELEQACCENISHVKSSVECCVYALSQGTISVRDLKMLKQHKDMFLSLAQILEYEVSKVEKAISCRMNQLKAFIKMTSTLHILKSFCNDLTSVQVETEAVDDILSRDVEKSMLNELVVVRHTDFDDDNPKYAAKVEIQDSKLSERVIDMVSRLETLKESSCFLKLWEDACENNLNDESLLSLDDMYDKVFQPVWERLQNTEIQISSGDISFRDMERFIGRLFEEHYDKMLSELKLFCCQTEEPVLCERLEQFKRCRHVALVSKIAFVLVQVKSVFDLTGDFSDVLKINQINFDDLALTADTEEILQSCNEFHKFTESRLRCLEAFVQSKDLVTWLRNEMKGGVKEVKVFVDLAMSSAGDDTEKISRVQSLHAVINGFSNVIFELNQEFGYSDFLKTCECVWDELSNTPILSDKLEYANKYLYWFKEIKQAHGAVEVTSFIQAEKINKGGIYKIGTHVRKADQEELIHGFVDSLDMKKVLKLVIPPKEGNKEQEEYTYDKLQDLQSRLMLVAGEAESSKQSIERFNSVLDGVVRLSSVYIKLVRTGCILFKDFAIQLYCDTSPGRTVVADLEFKNKGPSLKCRKTDTEKLEDVMHKIAKALEKCYESWLKHVDQNRTEFPELNYFTTEQLVILQTEIATLEEKEGRPSKRIYPMFHTIIPDCLPDDVIEALEYASLEPENNNDDQTAKQTGEESEEAKESKEDMFVRELIESGYEKLVPLALQKFPTYDLDDALMWCLENSDDVENLEEAQYIQHGNDDAENRVTENTVSIESLISKAMDSKSQFDRCDAMLIKLTEIWNSVLDSNSTNIRGFISLKQLGKLLRHMSRKDGRIFNRALPKGYSDTAPNLVVCNDGDIWKQTLSFYLYDEEQPLPQDDEVLTCSEETTLEHVDIFLRRAFFNSNGKLHCLVNPDRMSFTICEEIEQRVLKYQRETAESNSFRLVFICGFKSESRSVIIPALDEHRRTSFLLDTEILCLSLSNRLKVDENESSQKVKASSVDFQRSTVRVVRSTRSGAGKSLYVKRRVEELQACTKSTLPLSVSLPLHTRDVDFDYITKHLIPYVEDTESQHARIFHIDITSEVLDGIDYLLFNLLILGRLTDKSGYVWRKLQTDLYLVETLERNDTGSEQEDQVLKLLPFVTCRSPDECLNIYSGKKPSDFSSSDQLFDNSLYNMELYQNPYACLREIDGTNETSERHCIETLLRHCGISNPSWSEIYHFVKFLNTQLLDFQQTDFVSEAAMEALPGFPLFVQRFLIQMSRDFSSRSLNISEETNQKPQDNQHNELHEYQIKRTWEKSPHPYLFFNADRHTFTFLGFYINDQGDLVDIQNNTTLERSIMSTFLLRALMQNCVPIKEDFDSLPRTDKIARLCKVMGVREYDEDVYDSTYELTTDNCKKMLAVYMRLRCDIPVIVMGETGCGKTRLIKFLCELMVPRDEDTKLPLATNMIIVKVHGGVSNTDIKTKVVNAEIIANENMEKYNNDMYTVLFFDEANTTESIGLLKEIMCDKTMEGVPLNTCENLKIIVACNPYRRHPEEVIAKLEKAGLGYHVKAKKTKDRFGRIPMRRLVYRVQPLPQSLLPFVWDFGQLDSSVENLYIRHMVRRYMVPGDDNASCRLLPNDEQLLDVISSILTESQAYMRNLKDECSFVSLRDVERVLQVMCWFYERSKGQRTLFTRADKKLKESGRKQTLNDETRSLILALGVCYHASLTNREAYRSRISQFFRIPCELTGGPDQIFDEIDRVQEVFLDCVHLDDCGSIAKNQALKENVFMMVVCVELRIPLFLVGKPGSSKSLAKVIVTDAMQGRAAKSDLFRELKQVQMVSFQCSPLSTAGGILSIFHQCASFQENYKDNLDNFVSVVVLDEIGLAEDSERMPLKTLHPLLEDGCQGEETPEDYKKVAFIGISNWSLDPAKMNRGIFLQREVPDSVELQNTARGICSPTKEVNKMLIKPLATAYLKVFNKASEEIREFFGLRDFYSLMKMINHLVLNSAMSHRLTYRMLRFAVRRNFSGLENLDTFTIFREEIKGLENTEEVGDPDDSFTGLIDSWIKNASSESRHLLFLTENESALQLFQQAFLSKTSIKPVILYGSSFRRDQEYTKICRNINKIKICMETGKLVILVNSDNLYESLYDALNQYYVYFGGERYVDLGLGTHRVKCPVHKDFKLIIVAEKQTVYENFPIPLINRLEKHCLNSNTLLSKQQSFLARTLKEWVEEITKDSLSLREQPTETDAAKVFIGYHHDACSTIAVENWTDELSLENEDNLEKMKQALKRSRDALIWCTAPDAIARLKIDRDEIQDIYWNKHAHESLKDYLSFQFKERKSIFSQVTTHSSLLTIAHKETLCEATKIHPKRILLLEALPSFDTEQQFIGKIKEYVQRLDKGPVLLVIQCDSGDRHSDLIACAKYAIKDECAKVMKSSSISILFIVQLTPMDNRCFHSIQCGEWHSAHIDNLYSPVIELPKIQDMQTQRMSILIAKATVGVQFSQEAKKEQDIQHEKRLDLQKLIGRSLQRAVSLVKDHEEYKFRSTKRVTLILSILHENARSDRDRFIRGVGALLEKIIAHQENELSSVSGDNWFQKEASSVRAIQKFGTFRRACLYAFDIRISPILGGIFAVLDTNHNLDILECSSDSWQRNLWMNMINTKEVSQKVLNAVNTERGIGYNVQGTGCGDRIFPCKMPFSWIIHNAFEATLKQQALLLGDISDRGQNVIRILKETELFSAMETIPETCFCDVLECYINDFVNTVYPEERDRKLVVLLIKKSAIDQVSFDEIPSLPNALMYVHQVYQEASTSLKYFRDLSNVWIECTDTMLEETDNDVGSGHDLALRALLKLVDSISAVNKEVFISEQGRNVWLSKVHRYRQVVNQTIAFCQDTVKSLDTLTEARYKWNRVVVMQLFIEILFVKTEDKLPVKRLTVLWKILSEKKTFDLKNKELLTALERFLRLCFKNVKDSVLSDAKACVKCGRKLLNESVALQCDHEMCGECVAEIMQDKSVRKCPICKMVIENDSVHAKINSFAARKIRDYRQRCNSIFMEIVSQMCFADNTSPTPEVMNWLMSYSFKTQVDEIQELELHESEGDIGIDSNKVFKIFLFKHLVHTNEPEFRKRLEEYFGSNEDDLQLDNMFLPIIYTIEEYFDESVAVTKVKEWLESAPVHLENKDSLVDQIYCVAKVRKALSMCAHYINKLIGGANSNIEEMEETLLVANQLCDGRIHLWKYLMRFISQEFGSDVLLSACKSTKTSISWVNIEEKVACTVDMYTACGESYSEMKSKVFKAIVEKNSNCLLTYIEDSKEKHQTAVMLELVIHRETELQACLNQQQINDEEMVIFDEAMNLLGGCYEKLSNLAVRDLKMLHLNVIAGEDTDRTINIKCLLYHWFCVIKHVRSDTRCCELLNPLFKLALEPKAVKNAFLPAMPQDELADIRQTLLNEAENVYFGEETMYYQCENGHRYEIGQCGRPWAKAKCICGAEIGGESHQLHDKNIPDDGSDRTKTGHCLGLPQNRLPGAVPERSLSPTQCAVLKWLLHMTLYLGCNIGVEDICYIIHAEVDQDNVHQFLWDHILLDLEDLQNNLSLSVDEVFLLSHSIIDMIMKTGKNSESESLENLAAYHLEDEDAGNEDSTDETMVDEENKKTIDVETVNGIEYSAESIFGIPVYQEENENSTDEDEDGMLDTVEGTTDSEDEDINNTEYEMISKNDKLHWHSKQGRMQWETAFTTKYINPFIEEKNKIICAAKQQLQDSSPMLTMLNESTTLNEETDQAEVSLLQNKPDLWMYRKPVSIVHFKQAFQRYLSGNPSRKNDFPVLQLFMEQMDELQAVRLIPRILQLHKALLRRYNRKIYQSEALNIKVHDLKSDKFVDEEIEDLLKDFTDAWNIAKNSLKNHVFRTDKDSRTAIPEEIANIMITDETQLVYLLPTMDGKGICTFALLDYLVRCQNQLIETYKASLRREVAEAFTVVSPRDITSSHVVTFQPQNDLLPIILSNCSMRTNFTVEDNYDFEAVEKRVIDRFISTKSAINGGRRLQIDLMTYRSELTDASEIEMLHRRIPQERLEATVKSAICNGMVDVPVISQMLSTLDVAINFLNITGGNPDDSLHEYIVGRLKIREGVPTAKMQQECQLKHVKSLWITLSFHKSYIMVQQNKPIEIIFENIDKEYREMLPHDISQKCEIYAERLSKERLSKFLELLFEFITIKLMKKQTQNDEDFVLMSQYRMKDCLDAFADIASLSLDVSDVPDSILCAHSLNMWTVSSLIHCRRYKDETEL